MKRLFVPAMAALMALSLFSGCSKSSTEESAAVDAGSTAVKSESDGGETLETADLSKYITLGNYKGLKVKLADTNVTDEDVEEAEKNALSIMKTQEEVTDRPAELTDTVNIDYEGKKDGVAFEGGTAKGRDLDLGSHTFIDGFEDGLVGAKIGETRELNLTFPEDYHNADLAGQDVVFTVTLNSISANIIPEMTDEVAKKLDSKATSVEDYRKRLRESLQESKNATARSQAFGELLSKVQEDSKIAKGDELPGWLLDSIKEEQKENFEYNLEMYGMDLESYLKQQGMTEETFDLTLDAYAQSIAAQQLVVQALANAENIKVTDADLKAQYEEDAEAYGYETGEEFEKAVKAQNEEQTFRDATLTRKVEEMLLANAEIENPENIKW